MRASYGMSDPSPKSRGQQLLLIWQGDSTGRSAAAALDLDEPTFSRLRHGERLPTGAQAYRIEQLTAGVVDCRSWYEPAITDRRSMRKSAAR